MGRMRETFHKLSTLLITLPVLALPLTSLGLKPATAETVAAEQAVRILARAQAADANCQHLPAAAREELSGYMVKAELSAAGKIPAAEVKAAMKTGSTEGQARPCDQATKADIDETLAAARDAIAAAPKQSSKPARKAALQAKAPFKSQVTLKRYARLARPYFIERRCRHLGRGEQALYWQKIVHLHRAAVAESGSSAATGAMLGAERDATGARCGQTTLAAVTKGFTELTGQ